MNSVGPPCRGIREEDVDAGEVEEEDEGERDEERLPGAVGGEGADGGPLVARLEGNLRLWGHPQMTSGNFGDFGPPLVTVSLTQPFSSTVLF